MSTTTRWTSADLELLPDDGKRYEIIDGELHMSKQPHWYHQAACFNLGFQLELWNQQSKLGQVSIAPGVIFADDDDVAPDVVWISNDRLATALEEDGKLHVAPELVVEVLSSGSANERRDRKLKLELYSRHGVSEYWIVNWRTRQIELYRREQAQLKHLATLFDTDKLESPLLPGFSCPVASLFAK
ncbi:MAG: Uma2 family endonuclease [Blastocatellia bacterium]